MCDHNQVIFNNNGLPIQFILSKHAIDGSLVTNVLVCLEGNDVVAVESIVDHGAICSAVISDVDIFAVDVVLLPVG